MLVVRRDVHDPLDVGLLLQHLAKILVRPDAPSGAIVLPVVRLHDVARYIPPRVDAGVGRTPPSPAIPLSLGCLFAGPPPPRTGGRALRPARYSPAAVPGCRTRPGRARSDRSAARSRVRRARGGARLSAPRPRQDFQ